MCAERRFVGGVHCPRRSKNVAVRSMTRSCRTMRAAAGSSAASPAAASSRSSDAQRDHARRASSIGGFRRVVAVVHGVADGDRLAPTEQLELLPVALGEPHLELIALAEDHEVRVTVGSRIAAGMRTEKDDASHGGVGRELIDEPPDRLIHPANLPAVTASAWWCLVPCVSSDGRLA